ncbi:hypothetical protein R1sor_021900 [Riccia sorocarpa]|uniref:Integrase catalytic domain-containing protein n=1 Tax=Riccia sorocarpa TaxID=122646 RepID=A0ABD3GKI0_9MARC
MEGVQRDVPAAGRGKGQRAAPQEKGKALAYKLAVDIETATDLKTILEQRILDARVEFSLKEILGIAKREFHELIIDIIKRKRQTLSEQAVTQMLDVVDGVVEVTRDAEVFANGVDDAEYEYEALVAGPMLGVHAMEDDDDRARPPLDSEYQKEHWARATGEVKIRLAGLAELVTALVDHGSEINIISRDVYERGQWPIEKNHGWVLRAANNQKGELFGACPNVPVKVGDVEVTQHFFVQDISSYPVILGMPYITAVRIETKGFLDATPVVRDTRSEVSAAIIPSEQMTGDMRSSQGWQTGLVTFSDGGFSRFQRLEDMRGRKKNQLKKRICELHCTGVLENDEFVSGVFEECVGLQSLSGWFDDVQKHVEKMDDNVLIPLHSREVYEEIASFLRYVPHLRLESGSCSTVCWCNFSHEAEVHAKYKSVLKKVKPVATQLPEDSDKQMELAARQPVLRDVRMIGHRFTRETLEKLKIGGGDFLTDAEKKKFEEMIQAHGKAFAFSADEIGCVDPKMIAPMVIFTVPHVPWDLKPILVPRALLPKLIDLLKEKMRMGILEPSMAPYSSRWFTVPKKSGATNSVAHMQNAMHKVLRDFVSEVTIPFLDDIPMKGCPTESRDETLDVDGCRKFVAEHIRDVGRILTRLEEVHLTLSGEKSRFGVSEILVVGHFCGSFGRRPNPEKVDAIARMADCRSITEVRRFLGFCVFYRLSVPHYAHVAEPLYALMKKGRKFIWDEEHHTAMKRLKRVLQNAPVLRRLDYKCGRPIIITVDTSPKAVSWAVGQDEVDGVRFAGRFGAKILTGTQRDYPQVKRELWGVRTAMRVDRDLLIGAQVVLETDCLPLLGMIANCNTPDIAMLRWIAYIRSLNPELRHIAGKKNVVADMLSRARYEDEDELILAAEEEERRDAWCQVREGVSDDEVLPFCEELYSGRLRDIGLYMSTLSRREEWSDAQFKEIRQKAYGYLLRDGYLWRRPKRRDGVLLRVIDDSDTKLQLLKEFHEALWAGHLGVWATYMKLKERYWWKGLYKDVTEFVSSCLHCQFYSKVRYRDGLVPTYPPSIHFRWVLDLVMMHPGLWGMRYLVLAREDLSNFVEGRALRTKSTEGIYKFVLEDIVCRYGSVGSLRADRGELNVAEARSFFERFGVKLKLTTAMNPEGIGKSERGHPSVVHALVKACDGRRQKSIMPTEEAIPTWVSLPWEDGLDRESLLALRVRHLERREEDLADAQRKLKEARLKNKVYFDKTHRLRPKPIQPGDWVLVYDSTLENQHSTVRKFSRRWFGPYVVLGVNDNATYTLRELDGTRLRLPVAGKRVKLFRRRDGTTELSEFLETEPAFD